MEEQKQTTDYRKMALGEPDEPGAAPLCTRWHAAHRDEVASATAEAALAAFVASPEAARGLLARAKGGYQTDPLDAIRIASVTQYVMASPSRAAARRLWTEALMAAGEAAKDESLVLFLVDQFRWCGFAEQADEAAGRFNRVNSIAVNGLVAQLRRELRREVPGLA